MPISEQQLDTWKNQGAVTTSVRTHEAIRRAIADDQAFTDTYSPDPFLQGSDKNSTNIYGNSDVDLVVVSEEVFYSDIPIEQLETAGVATRSAFRFPQY